MAVPSPQSQKESLRKQARSARMTFVAGLEPGAKQALEQQLAAHLSDFIEDARVIGGYAAIGSEISPAAALAVAADAGKTIAYPTFSGDDDEFRFRAGEPVVTGPHQISQPHGDAPLVTPDLILIPLVACGDGGVRLGQGKGHYDRVLAGLVDKGAKLVGIGWQMQRIDGPVPSEKWDIPVHAFCSPRACEDF